ncbi:hypothetical protein FALCPG4_18860 [Fusarium falciforme]
MHLNPVPQGQGILKPVVGRAVGKRKLYQTNERFETRSFLRICLVSLAHALQEGELKAQSSCPCLFRTAHWAVFFPEYTEGTRELRTVKDHEGSDDRKRRGGPASSPKEAPGTGVRGCRVSQLVQQGQKRIPPTRGQQASAVALVPLGTLCSKVVSKALTLGWVRVLGVSLQLSVKWEEEADHQ